MNLRETRLREELQSREAENSRLREELRKCHEILQESTKTVRLYLYTVDYPPYYSIKFWRVYTQSMVIRVGKE